MINLFKRLLKKTTFYKKWLIKKGVLKASADIESFINTALPVLLNAPLESPPKVGIVKTQSFKLVEGYDNPKASWMRYERFCKNNNIPYGFLDLKKSDWLSEAQEFDLIVCHTEGDPAFQEMYEDKIYILEKYHQKKCFPSFHEVWQYEHKVRSHYLYEALNLPAIPTLVTHDKEEALSLGDKLSFPFIVKTTIGAGSSGVEKIDTQADLDKYVSVVFSEKGRKSSFLFQNQKDYVYAQSFIEDATFDLRIIIIGNMAFGYYRYPNEGDFRASGAGNFEKKAIPVDALKLAVEIRDKLQCRQIGVDLLYSEKANKYMIIETSVFNQIDTPVQLEVDGVAGYYDITNLDGIKFKEGKFWVQELILADLISI